MTWKNISKDKMNTKNFATMTNQKQNES